MHRIPEKHKHSFMVLIAVAAFLMAMMGLFGAIWDDLDRG